LKKNIFKKITNILSNPRLKLIFGILGLLIISKFAIRNINELKNPNQSDKIIIEAVLSSEGFVLPVSFADLGIQMKENGVIDPTAFEKIYESSPILQEEAKNYLSNKTETPIKITNENSNLLLNLFWGLGLGNKNPILEKGPIMANGDASKFASTGGWTIAKGAPMEHYSKYYFIPLNFEQQKLLEKISKNIYRPCCNNSTYFPDCNHGMAMLGLLELLIKQNVAEDEIYSIALRVNSYWFPSTYLNVANYFDRNENKVWPKINPKVVLGKDYSSAAGWQKVQSLLRDSGIIEISPKGGGKCNL